MKIHVDPNALLQHLQEDLRQFTGKDHLVAQPHEIAADILLASILKKYEPDGVSAEAAEKAITKFLDVNTRSAQFQLLLNTSNEDEFVGLVKDEIYRFWYRDGVTPIVDDAMTIFLKGGVGPGAAVDADGCDIYTKIFAGTLTGSRNTWAWWWNCTDRIKSWRMAMNKRQDLGLRNGVTNVSKVSIASKTADIGRTFFVQPAVSLWGQKGVSALIEERLVELWGLDLRNQEACNQLLAREGSLSQKFATIDSTSASDTISMELCARILPAHMYKMLCFFRCSHTAVPGKGRVRLGMMSEMGNGFNFALQIVIFGALIRATYRQAGVKPGLAGQPNSTWGVYGDDMVVLSTMSRRVLNYMELCGFMPNRGKTYVEGRFRESCGADFIDGIFVRGVYIKRLKTNEHLYVAINSLLHWSAQHEIPLPTAVRYLRRHLKGHMYLVPIEENADAGVRIPSSLLKPGLSPESQHADTQGCRRYWARRALTKRIVLAFDGSCIASDPVERSRPLGFSPDGWYLTGLSGADRKSVV